MAVARVLVLANRLPYPIDDGWKTRTYHIIRGLARHADVTLLVFSDDAPALIQQFRDSVDGMVEVVCVPTPRSHTPGRLLLGLVTRLPVYIWNMRSAEYRRQVRSLIKSRKPDIVVAQLTYMCQYLDEVPDGVTTVVDTHNIDSLVLERYSRTMRGRLRRIYAAVTARKLRRYEKRVFEAVDLVWVCSSAEVDLARGIAPTARVHVIPNGVDTTKIAPLPEVEPVPDRLLFFGRMDYQPNRDAVRYFALEILPKLRKLEGKFQLHVVGAGIESDLRELAGANPELKLIGRVEELAPVLATACIVVVPLRMGGGTRLKILEALAAGKAVVSTRAGAEGLALTANEDLVLADSTDDFASAIMTLAGDPDLRKRLGLHGRDTVRARFDWSAINQAAARILGLP